MTAHDLVEVLALGWQPTGFSTPAVFRVDALCSCGHVATTAAGAGEQAARVGIAGLFARHVRLAGLEDRLVERFTGQRLGPASVLVLTESAARAFAAFAVEEFLRREDSSPEAALARRVNRARALGLCGARFGATGVCSEPAGHEPIVPGQWEHAEEVGGPLGD